MMIAVIIILERKWWITSYFLAGLILKLRTWHLSLLFWDMSRKLQHIFSDKGLTEAHRKMHKKQLPKEDRKKKRKIQGQQKSNSFLRCGLRLFLTWQNFKLSTRSTESKQETKRNCWTRARRSFKLQDLKELQKQLSVNGSKKRMPEIMKSWVCFLWYMDTSVK